MDIKKELRKGNPVRGLMLSELSTPNLSRLFFSLHYDFMLIDCEHGYFDLTQTANLIAVAEGYDFPVLVRVDSRNYALAPKYLDMGARGILLANAGGPEQVKDLIDLCLYAPEGCRGVSTFRAHTGYNKSGGRGLLAQANARNLILVQIESPEAVGLAGSIASLEGLDSIIIGPNDLSQSMGLFGEYSHPKFLEAVQSVIHTARECGKASGIITSDEKLLRFGYNAGMRFFSAGSELSMLASGAKTAMERLRACTEPECLRATAEEV